METFLERIIRGIRYRLSRLILPTNRRKVIHSQINGYNLLVLANEEVGRLIHYRQRYERAETVFLRKKIHPNAICVDIGANVGYFTMLMAQAANAEGEVHTFEPIALNISLLRAGVELNGFTNVRINQCAVGNSTGTISFSQSSDSAYSSIYDTERKSLDRTISVPIITLDDYIEREGIKRIDVLKADVEGAEGLVVDGASKLLADEGRRPTIIMLELEEQNIKTFGSSISLILNKMHSYGYQPYVVNESNEILPFSIDLKEFYYNILFVNSATDTIVD
jgi:FkbM family methyltransferase